ncbi:hypothetical protein CTAYLR_000196 [Chrysophaeum taylorii]|uniref:K Homology domain-containing protein n=1 Tax=Chrysophaeum taylorii TaxID=2483200 RepID=A0AAD7UF80_9STRA|nr:hypothetical protein CTAYLR_000196 [Chrysophaeum taylorii]
MSPPAAAAAAAVKRKAPSAGAEEDATMKDAATTPTGRKDATTRDDATIPTFAALSAEEMSDGRVEYRKVRIPAHRYTPLRKTWEKLIAPLTQQLKLQVRFNPRTRCVELKTCPSTIDAGAIQKGADYVAAFAMGFEVQDAVALLRLDDLFVDSFEVKDVKTLQGDHLSRAIGRVAGADGKTRFAIENATRTRVVIANQHIHILGSTTNIKLARDAICDLIMGAPPGKVYNRMRTVAKRLTAARS